MANIEPELQTALKILENETVELETLVNSINNASERLDMEKSPLPQEVYDRDFDMLERTSMVINYNAQIYYRIKAVMEYYENKLRESQQALNNFAQKINENKFKYGLKGQIKQSINVMGKKPRMTYEQLHAYREDFSETPTVKKGGKKSSRRKLKNRTAKRR